jgi:hypothetical protein
MTLNKERRPPKARLVGRTILPFMTKSLPLSPLTICPPHEVAEPRRVEARTGAALERKDVALTRFTFGDLCLWGVGTFIPLARRRNGGV